MSRSSPGIPIWKRIFDFVVVLPCLMLAGPVMFLVALLIRATIGSPVLFRQLRPGFRGRPFVLYKFRTMRLQDDSGSSTDEQRISRVGGFLRKTSLDELPELWNVLKGEMSLVGPRPLLMQYLDRYSPEQRRRHEVLPGITGWAQVNGRNAVEWEQRLAMDVWYVDHHTLWLDLKILALTVIRVLGRQGISRPGHATMPEFTKPISRETPQT